VGFEVTNEVAFLGELQIRIIVYYNILTYSFTVLVSNSADKALN
jgi:hypothetical protein